MELGLVFISFGDLPGLWFGMSQKNQGREIHIPGLE
jgi:hypothetical protein